MRQARHIGRSGLAGGGVYRRLDQRRPGVAKQDADKTRKAAGRLPVSPRTALALELG